MKTDTDVAAAGAGAAAAAAAVAAATSIEHAVPRWFLTNLSFERSDSFAFVVELKSQTYCVILT